MLAFPLRVVLALTTAATLAAATATAQTQFRELPPTTGITAAASLPPGASDTWALAYGDLDGDADADLITGNVNDQNRLYLNNGSGVFVDGTTGRLPVRADTTRALAIGDVDGDGDLDLLVGNDGQQNRLLLNDGTGIFTDATTGRMPVFSDPTQAVALFDMDGDGDLDFVSGNDFDQNRLYENDGAGFFTNRTGDLMPPAMETTRALAIGDVDGDGDPDMVIGNYSQQSRLYLNNGIGLFSDAPTGRMPAGASLTVRALALADFNRDGDLDLLLGTDSGPDAFYENSGAGAFADATAGRIPAATSFTTSLAVTDVDGDGDLDAALGQESNTRVRLYLNDGTGTLRNSSVSRMPPSAAVTRAVAFADVDGDGDPDLTEGNNPANRLRVNQGNGSFVGPRRRWIPGITNATHALATGDLDTDGDLDVVVGNSYQANTVLLNDGRGVLSTSSSTAFTAHDTRALALGDVDGDLDLDLVAGNAPQFYYYYGYYYPIGGDNQVYLNDGTGRFTTATSSLPYHTDWTTALAMADIDRDGDLDLFFGNATTTPNRQNRLYVNDGSGTFADASLQIPLDSDRTRAVLARDFDQDGDLDVVCGNAATRNRMYVNDGNGTFTDLTAERMPGGFADDTRGLASGDVDGDGDLDLLIANAFTSNRLYLNNGHGAFTDAPGRLPADADDSRAAALVDLDLDGDLDAVIGNAFGRTRIYLNDGTGSFADASTQRIPADTVNNRALAVADLDRDGDPDLLVGADQQPDRYYFNLHRHVYTPRFPTLGTPYEIELYAEPGYGAQFYTGVALLGFSLTPGPLPIPGLGNLFVAPPLFALPPVGMPRATGAGVLSLPIPGNPAFTGVELDIQAAVLGDQGGVNLTGYTTDVIR